MAKIRKGNVMSNETTETATSVTEEQNTETTVTGNETVTGEPTTLSDSEITDKLLDASENINSESEGTLKTELDVERGLSSTIVHIDEAAFVSVPTIAPTEEPVVVPNSTPVEPVSDFKAAIAAVLASGKINHIVLVETLDNYVTRMAPGVPITEVAGAKEQYSLWKAIKTVVEGKPQDFKQLWNIILAYFNEYENSTLHDKYVFRFSSSLNMEKSEIDAFYRILNLIKLTANPGNRASGLKQLSLNKTLEIGFSEEGKQRILSFYGL
jgi:hypothetical protein